MKLTIDPESPETFRERSAWRYPPPYDFYDGEDERVLNPERFFEARDENGGLVGLYYFEPRGSELYYGLGLAPHLTGRGLGLEFLLAGLEFVRRRCAPERFTLSVAAFNDRARIIYERAGFPVVGRHVCSDERWGEVEFLDMAEIR